MASNFNIKGIAPGTVARTAVLILALTNQALTMMGKSVIPIEDEDLNALITTGLTIGSALIAWWHNNSLTNHAQTADEYMRTIKNSQATLAAGRRPTVSNSNATARQSNYS